MVKLVAVIALLLAFVGMSAPAQAEPGDWRTCVTRGEYDQLKPGMAMSRVHEIFDTEGERVQYNYPYQTRHYRPCNPDVIVIHVEFAYRHVTESVYLGPVA